MRWLAALFLTTLLGCDSPSATPDSSAKPGGSAKPAASTGSQGGAGTTNASAASAPKLCEKADKLAKRIADINVAATRVSVPADLAMPESKDGSPVSPDAVALVVGAKDVRLGSDSFQPAEAIAKLQGQRRVLLAIPKDESGVTKAAEVAKALGGDMEVYLIAAIPGGKREPAPKGLDVTTKNVSERAMLMAEALTKTIDGCPEAKKLFSRLAGDDPSARAATVKKEFPIAVNACSCKVADNTDELIAYLLGGDPAVVGKRFVVDKGASTKISAKDLTGQKLYDSLPADGSAVAIEK